AVATVRPCSSFFLYYSANHQALHSFPTRRSSDLFASERRVREAAVDAEDGARDEARRHEVEERVRDVLAGADAPGGEALGDANRSEEHTSELQSLTNLVCRLLLEKKKVTHAHSHS